MSVSPGLVDANVLVYAVNADVPQHPAAKALLTAGRDPAVTLYLTSQVLCEFYSVITNPRRVVNAASPSNALRSIEAILAFPGVRLLPSSTAVVQGWISLLHRRPVTGADIYDLQLVATMLANGVHRIYTYNPTDFRVFPELVVVEP